MDRVKSAFLARLDRLLEHRTGPFSLVAVSVGGSDIFCDMGCSGELVNWENHVVWLVDADEEEDVVGRYNLIGT